ncbi:tyrosine-type recombinase/integrase [Ureibacillus chungkukjangi]|uniref:tyrosine-type recombinase/integrase n=1 Tax=Ureibacillus chungkukjangi TaxID=1202712 RepID=UPI00384C7369
MKYVEPIRDKRMLKEFIQYFIDQGNKRNYVMFMVGIYLGLRISDILLLRKRDLMGTYLMIEEQKTGNYKRAIIEPKLREILDEYMENMSRTDLLFPSRNKDKKTGKIKPIDRTTAYKILKDAAKALDYDIPIGTHTLRKTFGYTFYTKHKDVAALQEYFGHEEQSVTLRYIGATQHDLDNKMTDLYD